MKKKLLAWIVIIAAIILIGFTSYEKFQEHQYMQNIKDENLNNLTVDYTY